MSERDNQGVSDRAEFLASLASLLAPADLKIGHEIPQGHLSDWSGESGGAPLALCFPRSTDSVSAILTLCHQRRVPVVPQGGLTGLAGGAVPSEQCLLLSLSRMRNRMHRSPLRDGNGHGRRPAATNTRGGRG